MRRQGMGQSKSTRMTLQQVHTPQCGKMAYVTRADAKKALKGHRRRAHFDSKVRPYRCPDCGYWHLGHMPGVVRAGMATADEFYGRAETA